MDFLRYHKKIVYTIIQRDYYNVQTISKRQFIFYTITVKQIKLDTGRYTPECLTEREQVKHISTLVITENKTTLLCQ